MISWITLLMAAVFMTQAEPKGSERQEDPKAAPQPRDFSFKLSSDGHIELTVREEDASTKQLVEKAYKADSLDEFQKTFPELSKRFRIDLLAFGEEWPHLKFEDLDKKFEQWKLRFDGRWFWDRSQEAELDRWFRSLPKALQTQELTRWFEEQRKLFEKFRQLHPTVNPDRDGSPDASKAPPKLGILITPVGDTLAHQLGFENVEGVVVAAVQSGSLADRSGLRKDDIVIKIDGKTITDTASFRKEVLATQDGFQLDILRRGKHETIRIQFSK